MTQDQNRRKNHPPQKRLIGSALLKKDDLLGKKFWVSWDGEGNNEAIFSGGQPLVFPPEPLQVGTIIHLLPPEG